MKTTTESKGVTFMDLPPEIRAMVYTWLLYVTRDVYDKTVIDINGHNDSSLAYCTGGYNLSRGTYMPSSTGMVLTRAPPHYGKDIVAFRHRPPAIWQLNRQIRCEARSLYITKHMSIDLAWGCFGFTKPFGSEDLIKREAVIEYGVALLEDWLERVVEHDLRKHIRNLVISDHVVIRPCLGNKQHALAARTRKQDFNLSRYMQAININVSHDGDVLTISSCLELEAT